MSGIGGAWAAWKARTARERRQWYALLVIAGLLIPVLGVPSGAALSGGFEIDANQAVSGDHLDPSRLAALYAGNDQSGSGQDWVAANGVEGVFTTTSNSSQVAEDCYLSDVYRDPAAEGISTFMCDGHANGAFSGRKNSLTSAPENNIVSPSGKSFHGTWPIKPGGAKPKNDFTHAYVYAEVGDSPCDGTGDNDDLFLRLAGHRGDNEGDATWGFEFLNKAPGGFDNLKNDSATNYSLVYDREPGDLLIVFDVKSGGVVPVIYTIATGTNPSAGEDAQFEQVTESCKPGETGQTALATNATDDDHDIEAPPWNIPVCDPTLENGNTNNNQCRLARTGQADHLIGDRLFAEVSIDLQQFNIDTVCLSSVVFSSRSSTSFDADIDDVGGGDFNLCGAKTGTKFHDHNANGVKDSGDEGLSGWTIAIYSDDTGTTGSLDEGDGATFSATTVTDTEGAYSFPGLLPGNYIVCEVQQAGWFQSTPTATTGDCSADPQGLGLADGGHAFTMTSAGHDGNDFGNYQQGVKSGAKFHDLDADGVWDSGEPGLGGWTINVYEDTGTPGALDGETVLTSTVTTDTTGAYSFDLDPGTYIVCEVLQANWIQSYPVSGAACSGTGLGPNGYSFTLTSGDTSTHTANDFGNYQNGTKTGAKFEDVNANGAWDAGEPGLGGWTIRVYEDTGTIGSLDGESALTSTTTADTTGAYSFELKPGSYIVCEVIQAGWTQSFPTSGADCSSSSSLGANGYSFTITSGDTTTHVANDFGNFQQGIKSGLKFEDLNANGALDQGEPGLSGWTIDVYSDSGTIGSLDSADTPLTSTVTGSDGSYSFSLDPGSYLVCEVMQSPWIQSFPTSGADCTNDSTLGAVGYSFTITSGDTTTHTANDFGNYRNGTKSGAKFEDLDADGTWDEGEPGLAGWTINIYSGTGSFLTSTVTADTTGAYSFELTPGSYIVCEVMQTGWTQSVPSSGADCSSIDASLGPVGYSFTLTSGDTTTHTGNDFGNWEQGTARGMKVKDVDANGEFRTAPVENADVGIAGWTVTVYADDGSVTGTLDSGDTLIATTVTATGGVYSFDLDPGDYIVCEATRSGWTQTAPTNTVCAGSSHAPGGFTVTVTSGADFPSNNFLNAPLSTITVTFDNLGKNTDGTDATKATKIECVGVDPDNPSATTTVGSATDTNTLTTDELLTSQSPIVCTVTFVDP